MRGGKRENSGRKPLPECDKKVHVGCTLEYVVYSYLCYAAEEEGKTITDMIRTILYKYANYKQEEE